jgi:PAS domain S-box-containing protein
MAKTASRLEPAQVLRRMAFLFAAYLGGAELGNFLSFQPSAFSTFWPPSGIFLAALLFATPRYWPFLILSGIGANIGSDFLHGRLLIASLGFSIGNSLEALAGAAAFRYLVKGRIGLESLRSVLLFVLVPVISSTTLSAFVGSGIVTYGLGFGEYWRTWFTWWSADVLGVLLLAPLIIAWRQGHAGIEPWLSEARRASVGTRRPMRFHILEALGLLAAVTLISAFLFSTGEWSASHWKFVLIPLVAWAAIRFRESGTATANFLLSLAAVYWTSHTVEGLVPGEVQDRAFLLQSFLAVVALTGLLLAASQTERVNAEAELRRQKEKYESVVKNAPIGIFRSTLDGKLLDANPRTVEILGYPSAEELIARAEAEGLDRTFYVEPGRRDSILAEIMPRTWSEFDVRLRKLDGSAILADIRYRRILDEEDRTEIEGFMEDVTELREAEAGLKKALNEKGALLKELEHRVKNNLNVVSSLLSLGAQRAGQGAASRVLLEAQTRVRSMALIYERLYRSEDFASIGLDAYLGDLASNLLSVYELEEGRVSLELKVQPISMDLKRAVPLGLIVNELISNSLKHAFPGSRKGMIRVELAEEEGRIRVSVEDDGVGLPPRFDPESSGGLGLEIVKTLAAQLGAESEVDGSRGVRFTISFQS